MADVCSLIVATVVTLQACYSPIVCTEDGDKKFCTGGHFAACPSPEPWWECKTPEGDIYALTYKDRKPIENYGKGR